MRRRVVVWGTGAIGIWGLRGLIDHPEYELVGLHAWAPDKVGRDAGEIAGLDVKTGVIATDDPAKLIALKPDCLVFQGNYAQREAECVAEVVPFLEAGINVVGPSMMDLIAPKFGRPEFVEPIEAACKKGGSSIFCGGTDPGYMTIGHLFSLLSVAGKIDCVTVTEMCDNQNYPSWESLKNYGFDQPLDYRPPMFTDPIGKGWHESTIHGIADYLGVELDEITASWDTAALDFDYQGPFGLCRAGHTAAIHWNMTGIYKGKPLIVYNKIERIHPDAGMEFGVPINGTDTGYRVTVEGDPAYHTEMCLDFYDGCKITALHPINMINAVCDAEPGVVGQLGMMPSYSKNIRR